MQPLKNGSNWNSILAIAVCKTEIVCMLVCYFAFAWFPCLLVLKIVHGLAYISSTKINI